MLARQRQEEILEEIRRTGGVRVSQIVDQLGVSDMTVRRDIAALADRGLVVRGHGGATLAGAPHSSHEPQFLTKAGTQRAEKLSIARVAAALVAPGSSVALSGGTTPLGLTTIVRLDEVDVFATDDGLGAEERTAVATLGGRLVIAPLLDGTGHVEDAAAPEPVHHPVAMAVDRAADLAVGS